MERDITIGALAVIAIDQATKIVAPAMDRTPLGSVIEPGLNRAYSLGVLEGSPILLILGTAMAITAGAIWSARAVRSGRLPVWASALLVGGASSNLIDRIARGGVLDFIAGPWFVWNLADLGIAIGLIRMVRSKDPSTFDPKSVLCPTTAGEKELT